MELTTYQSPFSTRYGSKEMRFIFSPHFKFSTWRKLWIALAEAERELGLSISQAQIDEMVACCETLNLEQADAYEKKFHHDVVAHIHAFGDQCPSAKPIIHLGATSCYVTDNAEIIQMREGLRLIQTKLLRVIKQLSDFAKQHANTPTLSFTHFQPAQVTTVGKRACLWLQDFLMDYHEILFRLENLRFLGAKGATGTQASFLTLFEQDHAKVKELDRLISQKMHFSNQFIISGQTYTRKQDLHVLSALAEIAVSAHKMAVDLRLLAHLGEVEEPFEDTQVGSSAMPYKKNPILSERICSLARFLISLVQNPAYTAATQWLERTLDDSANRRLSLPESFLSCDAILELLLQLTQGLVVNTDAIHAHISRQLPFLAAETILMVAVKKGGDRQLLHEKLRSHWQETLRQMKENGIENTFWKRIQEDPTFQLTSSEIEHLQLASNFTGRAFWQVQEFLEQEVLPIMS